MASFHLNSSVHIANFRAKFLLLVETLKKSSFSMKFFIGPSRVRIPPRTQTQQKRGASVNFVIIFLVVSRSFKTVTTACCIRKKVTICAAYSLRWGKKLKNWKRENVKNALAGTNVFFRLGGMCCYSVIDKIVIFAMSWAWKLAPTMNLSE